MNMTANRRAARPHSLDETLCTTVIPAKAGIQRGGGLARMVSFTTPDVASSGRLRKGLLTGEG